MKGLYMFITIVTKQECNKISMRLHHRKFIIKFTAIYNQSYNYFHHAQIEKKNIFYNFTSR